MKLHLAEGLSLPLDTVTEKLAWMGRTGSGKTYGATKLAELMLAAGAQVIALDPVGVWSGLRIGNTEFPIYIFGGLRKDFPLEPTGGALMADLIVDRGISAVLDVSQFGTDTEHRRFATDFLTRFFQRKKAAPSAVHVFLEECQEFAPQDKQHGDEAMLHATQRLWKQGRNFGIGGSLISQRPQDVNKKVLEMTGTMFAFETTGPNAKKAIAGWMDAHDIDASVADLLPTLKQGEPYVWSPTFLGVQKVVKILPKATADVSSTPKVGTRAKERPLTSIDVATLATQMAATIEKAKADDPRELRKTIAELKKELAAKSSVAQPKGKVTRVEVAILKDGQIARLEKLFDRVGVLQSKFAPMMSAVYAPITEQGAQILGALNAAGHRASWQEPPTTHNPTTMTTARPSPHVRPPAPASRRAHVVSSSNGHGPLDRTQQRTLDAIAMLNARGIDVRREAVARWMGIHPNGGRYMSGLARLRDEGYLDGWTLTDKGAAIAAQPSTGPDAALAVIADGTQRRTLEVLLAARQALTREQLAERLGIHPNGGRFMTGLARLREMGVITERSPIEVTAGVLA